MMADSIVWELTLIFSRMRELHARVFETRPHLGPNATQSTSVWTDRCRLAPCAPRTQRVYRATGSGMTEPRVDPPS